MVAALMASCSIRKESPAPPPQDDVIFYASFERPAEEGTKVYANEDLLLRWTADDRVSIFNLLTYNQQDRFTGETGDNAGEFAKVAGDEFVTGNPIAHVVSVHPYRADTKITEDEVLTFTLPAEQHYAGNTFGLGANSMVAVSSDNVLIFKNVCGYLRLSLFGEGVSISSITLNGNHGEKLAGKASVIMPLNGIPSVSMASSATDEITLICDSPVPLGATAQDATTFWFVLPPVTFDQGFSILASSPDGLAFVKSTSKSITIERSHLSKIAPTEVELASIVISLALDKTSVSMKIGESASLKATSKPDNVPLTWTSSDDRIVTVYNGVITALKAGEAVITVQSGDKSAQCAVQVSDSSTGIGDWEVGDNSNGSI